MNATTNADTSTMTKRQQLAEFVVKRATDLKRQSDDEQSFAKASLYRLRRGASCDLDRIHLVWADLFEGFPEPLIGTSDDPNVFEKSAYTALTLFAVHQQSLTPLMHKENVRLGQAVRHLATKNGTLELEQAPVRRFMAVLSADSRDELVHHLRGLIRQFRQNSIPLDYGQLSKDLLSLNFPESSSKVHLRWARDLHRSTTPSTTTNK